MQYAKENLASIKVKLSPEDVQEVRRAATKADAIPGDRYPPVFMKTLLADTPPL